MLLNLARNYSNRDIFDGVDTGRAVVVQSSFTELQYREDFDILVPPLLGFFSWKRLGPTSDAGSR